MHTALRIGVAAFLLTACGGDKGAATDSAALSAGEVAAVPVDAGAEKYGQVCGACHQANGEGIEGNFPPLAGSEWMTGNAEVPVAIVLHGMQGEIEVKGVKYNGVMAAWGDQMTDEEIAAVITHERTSWGNSASAVSAAEVKVIRDKYASRTTPWTAADLQPLR
jgi:mono/diheme cytochrome c family protein